MKRTGGVADYFAILGIGETLELRSTQKKYQRASNLAGGDEKEKLRHKEAILEEEECSMIERFYREIVEVCIFTAYSDEIGEFVGGTLATSVSASGGGDDGSYDENGEFDQSSYENDSYRQRDYEKDGGKVRYKHQKVSSSIVPSPKKLSRKSMDDYNDGGVSTPQDLLPKEISGFQIIYEATSSQSQQAGVCPNISGISHGTDNDLSLINSSVHQNSTFDSTTQQPLDADLNPATGLMSTSNSFEKTQQDASFSNLSFETQSEKKEHHWSKFNRGIGISKTIREQISPILATKTKAMVGQCGIVSQNSSETLDKHFYIGFRRRGADETEKPAVADLLLMYCKIYKTTILESEIQRNFETGNASNRMSKPNISHDQDGQNIDGRKNDPGSPRLAPKTAAVLKRGLLSGANIAKRVAMSGKNRLLRGPSNESMIEVDEEEEEFKDIESKFDEDFIEEVDYSDDENEESEDILFMNEILDLPKGFENGEWIIPCAFQTIKIPCSKTSTDRPPATFNKGRELPMSQSDKDELLADRRMKKTYLFNHRSSPTWGEGVGVEACVNGDTFLDSNCSQVDSRRNPWSPINEPPEVALSTDMDGNSFPKQSLDPDVIQARETLMPSIISNEDVASALVNNGLDESCIYVPIVAVRRQRTGEEERFHEDPGIIDIALTLSNTDGTYAVPEDDDYDEFDDNNEDEVDEILGKSKWTASRLLHSFHSNRCYDEEERGEAERILSNLPTLIFQRNLPNGFLDTPFATSVLDRFPSNNYPGAPLPEEELPMFCYVSSYFFSINYNCFSMLI